MSIKIKKHQPTAWALKILSSSFKFHLFSHKCLRIKSTMAFGWFLSKMCDYILKSFSSLFHGSVFLNWAECHFDKFFLLFLSIIFCWCWSVACYLFSIICLTSMIIINSRFWTRNYLTKLFFNLTTNHKSCTAWPNVYFEQFVEYKFLCKR